MLTLFAIPKPFVGHFGVIQRNAVRSWIILAPEVQVILVGDEEGVAEAAMELGVEHLAKVGRNEFGTPRLDDALARVDAVARYPLRCFVNADIVLLDDFLPAVRAIAARSSSFLMVGESHNMEINDPLDLSNQDVRAELRGRAARDGRSRGATAIDYFVFTAGLFDPVPPFVVGRARFDNWLVWCARQRGMVVDASRAVVAVHEAHDYNHVAGGQDGAHFGAEAERNLDLAGGKRRLFTIYDSSHRLGRDRSLHRNVAAIGRLRENARKVAWKLTTR